VTGPETPGSPVHGAGAEASPAAPATPPAAPAPPPPPFTVRRVTEDAVLPVQMLLAICGRHMATAHGFDNWRKPYPLDRLRADARERAVYAVYEQETLVATFTLADRPVQPYDDPSIWARPDDPAIYVNRLAVSPGAQGRGIGAWCMRWIERKTARSARRAVRLDALAANQRLLDFYFALGYEERGRRSHGGYEFACLELEVEPVTVRKAEGPAAGTAEDRTDTTEEQG